MGKKSKRVIFLFLILVVLGLLTLTPYFLKEPMQNQGSCSLAKERNYGCYEICKTPVQIGPYDAFTYLTIGPLSLILSILLLLVTCWIPSLRKAPGDLVIGLSIAEIFLSCHWISLGVYSQFILGQEICDYSFTTSYFCVGQAYFSSISGGLEYFYNFSLILYIYQQAKYPLTSHPTWYFHIGAVLLIIFFIVFPIYFQFSSFGPTFFGTCSDQPSCELLPDALFLISIFAFFGIYVMHFIKYSIPGSKAAMKVKKMYESFYTKYIIVCILTWFPEIIFNFFLVFDFRMCSAQSFAATTYSLSKIFNTLKMLSGLVLPVFRLSDPFLRMELRNRLTFTTYFAEDDVETTVIGKRTGLEEIQFRIMSSFLSGVLKAISKEREGCCVGKKQLKDLEEEDYLMKTEMEQEEDSETNIGSLSEGCEGSGSFVGEKPRALGCRLTSFAPLVFDNIVMMDKIDFNIADSLDIRRNLRQIQKTSNNGGGGRSNQFFFFSFDNNIIIKTLTDEETETVRGLLKDYYDYLTSNPDSLLARFYGLFRAQNAKTGVQYNLLLMKNINGLSSQMIQRVFDIKGSKLDRKVLTGDLSSLSPTTMKKIKEMVLKDVDFVQLEEKLCLTPEKSQEFYKMIKKDSDFLKEHGLMDYSLLIFMIQYPPSQQSTTKKYAFQSSENPSIFYHFGIIDYLQKFDTKKKMEFRIKQIKNFDLNPEVSATNPKDYADRFQRFLSEICSIRSSERFNSKSTISKGESKLDKDL